MKIRIAGKYWQHFNNFTLSSMLDAVASTFSVEAGPYDPSDAQQVALFKTLTYPKIEFFNDEGNLMSTGTVVSHKKRSSPEARQMVKMTGYSLGGVLEDCHIPYEMYPLESNNRSLKEIAERLLGWFGLKLIVYDSASRAANEVIETSVAEPEETVKAYLSKIASQKNILLSHDIFGHLILFKPNIDAPAKMFFDKTNSLEMELETNGQRIHSELTVLRQPEGYSKKNEGSSELTAVSTIKNTYVPANVKRSFVTVLTAGSVTGTDDAVHNALAAELQNIRVTVNLDRWISNLSFGDIVEIQNDEIDFPDRTRMMIHQIDYEENSVGQNMNIKLVLPESFTAGKPKRRRHDKFQHL